jgi:hypothetical protein
MRLDRLRGGELLAGAGAVVLFGSLFLPWFGKVSPVCTPLIGHSCGRNLSAWQAFGFTDIVLLAAALAGAAMVVAGGQAKTDSQITSAAMTAPLGALATVLVLYRIVDPVGDMDLRIGLFLGLAGCLAVTYGAWRAVRNERPSRVARPTRLRPASRTR